MTCTIIYMCFTAPSGCVCVREWAWQCVRNATVDWGCLAHSPPVSFAPLACVGICNLAKREITFKLNCKPNKLRGFGAGMGGVAAQLNLPEIYDYDWTQMEFLSFCGLLSV